MTLRGSEFREFGKSSRHIWNIWNNDMNNERIVLYDNYNLENM